MNVGRGLLRRAAVVGLALTAGAAAAQSATPDLSHMGTVYLVLLKKGPAWSAEQTASTKAIQEAHLANIHAMWVAKKLVIAGPMAKDEDDIRGIFVFKVPTLAEVESLVASDPAVKAGRLKAEIHQWWVDMRALPEAGAYCQDGK